MSARPRKTLIITGCREVHRGQGTKGEYVIYAVQAKTEQGETVKEDLRCFKPLEVTGEALPFEVERYDGGARGVSFTLHPLKKATLEDLERQVQELRERITRLESGASPPEGAPAAAPAGPEGAPAW